jgi:hypothetical protein
LSMAGQYGGVPRRTMRRLTYMRLRAMQRP